VVTCHHKHKDSFHQCVYGAESKILRYYGIVFDVCDLIRVLVGKHYAYGVKKLCACAQTSCNVCMHLFYQYNASPYTAIWEGYNYFTAAH
jgi:hypothetical protein